MGYGTGWMGRLGGCAALLPSPGLAQFHCPRRYVRPLHTLLSALVVTVALGALVWAAETQAAVRRCRRSHPAACLAAVLAFGLLVLWAVGGACTFLLSIAGPVLRKYPLPVDRPINDRRLRTVAGQPRPKRGRGHQAGVTTPPSQSAFPGFAFPLLRTPLLLPLFRASL